MNRNFELNDDFARAVASKLWILGKEARKINRSKMNIGGDYMIFKQSIRIKKETIIGDHEINAFNDNSETKRRKGEKDMKVSKNYPKEKSIINMKIRICEVKHSAPKY
jgi:hypothetical protein